MINSKNVYPQADEPKGPPRLKAAHPGSRGPHTAARPQGVGNDAKIENTLTAGPKPAETGTEGTKFRSGTSPPHMVVD